MAKPKKQEKKPADEENAEEKTVEPELKVLREIKSEIQEIKEELEEDKEREEFSEDFALAEDSASRETEAPILKKRKLEQTVDEESFAPKKEEKEKADSGTKYTEMESDYLRTVDEDREDNERERRRDTDNFRLAKVEIMPQINKEGTVEKRVLRERPIQFIDESARGHVDEVMKYEKVDFTKSESGLPFNKKEDELQRRVKKYKK